MNAIRTPVLHAASRHPLLVRAATIGALSALGLAVLPACTSQSAAPASYPGLPKATDVALVRYTSCDQALRNLRAVATAAVAQGRLGGGYGAAEGAAPGQPRSANAPSGQSAPPQAAGVPGASGTGTSGSGSAGQASGAPAPGYYSGTNDAVAGVDEPDLIKTDGRRIVTVIAGVLRVVDAQTHQLTGALDLSTSPGLYGASAANLLLFGDHALVLLNPFYPVMMGPMAPAMGGAGSGAVPGAPGGLPGYSAAWGPIAGPRLLLVDLSTGTPSIISEYTMDGSLVDARLVGSVARVVVRSVPRLFIGPSTGYSGVPSTGYSGAGTPVGTRAVIARAGVGAWLPRYVTTAGGVRRIGRVGCADVSHPATTSYTGGSMLTVLSFDLSGSSLGDGQPVTVVADGGTVYSNGASLYVANDQQWITPPATPPYGTPPATPEQYVGLYKFSIAGPGLPVYEASGTVPGWLLGSAGMSQYALSEWNGALRVATTTGTAFCCYAQPQSAHSQPQSAVYELEQAGNQLVIVGKVGGLGAGEQVYAVRFAGPVGYVVTFRQVDPLYTLDLSDPAQPRVAGELLLSGYSAYLDPIDAVHLIGVGQAANVYGETLGTQVSLFDVSDLAAPARLAVYHLRLGHSEAEFDPHAFLYWPISRIVVIPVQAPYAVAPVPSPLPGSPPVYQRALYWPASAALVLRVGEHSLTKLGMIHQPAVPGWPGGGQIRRSLVIGNTVWTLSDAGLQANDLITLEPIAWVPFG